MTELNDWLRVSGQVMEEEMGHLQQMIREIGWGAIVVELGTCQGRSTCALAAACELLQGYVWTVDDFNPETGAGYVLPDLAEARKNIAMLGLQFYVTIIVGDSAEVGLGWHGPLIDLWFHDAGHYYKDVKKDIKAWKPHIKPGGLMAFHDYTGMGPDQIGISQAANELLGKPIHVSSRLGIFRIGQ